MNTKGAYLLTPILLLASSCSVQKFIPEGSYLLDKVKVESDSKEVKPIDVRSYIRQTANNRWFSLVKVPMHIYALSGRDTTKWMNRFIQRIGDKPVIYDPYYMERSKNDMRHALMNRGYMQAQITTDTKVKNKKLALTYNVHPGTAYRISSWKYEVGNDSIRQNLQHYHTTLLHRDMNFDVDLLDAERQQITNYLQNRGFYNFNKELITCTADTMLNTYKVELTFHIAPSTVPNLEVYKRFTIGKVKVLTDFDMTRLEQSDWEAHYDSMQYKGLDIYFKQRPFLRPEVLAQSIRIEGGDWYREDRLQRTQSILGRLSAVRYSDVRYVESKRDSSVLDAYILLSRNRPNSFSAEIEGTNSAGDLGAAASVSYQNKNLFRGSELFTLKLRGAYEAVTGLQGYTNENYTEYGVETSINFPRFLFPFISSDLRRRILATSEVALQYNSQDRPEFSRRAASASWSYRWAYRQKWQYKVDVLDLNYVYMPWISPTFRRDYLDNPQNQNSILKYNYNNLLIMKMGYGFTYHSDGSLSSSALGNSYSVRFNIESAGNMLYAFSHLFKSKRNDMNQYTVMNIGYAQYIKADVDYAKSFRIDWRNSIVFHIGTGIAYPYGNSEMLPFEKRYFAGGANSVRGWLVRRLGPGKFMGNDRNIDFMNQSGDIKLDVNLEYRTKLFWKLNGAFFVDAGNIWTIKEYQDQPGGAFRFDSFYKQIALAYGIGFRFDFDYFVLRFDGGMKAINPAYESGKARYPIIHPDFGRDFAFHFAVGYPF